MDLDTNDLLALVLAALAFGTVLWLALRFKRVRNAEIIAAILPRGYMAVMYVLIVVLNPDIESSRIFIRLGVLVLFLFENINHFTKWRASK